MASAPTRDELDTRARELDIDPASFSTKDELEAAIDTAATAREDDDTPPENPDVPEIDPDDVSKGTVLRPLTHNGKITPPGEKVPKYLDELEGEHVETLREQGAVK